MFSILLLCVVGDEMANLSKHSSLTFVSLALPKRMVFVFCSNLPLHYFVKHKWYIDPLHKSRLDLNLISRQRILMNVRLRMY